MGIWISDILLKYKFWVVNVVVFFIILLLVLFVMQQEVVGCNVFVQCVVVVEGELVQSWLVGSVLFVCSNLLLLEQVVSLGGIVVQVLGKGQGWIELFGVCQGDILLFGVWVGQIGFGQCFVVFVLVSDLWQVFVDWVGVYVVVVLVLMLVLLVVL